LDTVNADLEKIKKYDNFYMHCAGGYRSVIMASILKSRGIHNLINVEKGFAGIRNTAIKTTQFVCPSTLK